MIALAALALLVPAASASAATTRYAAPGGVTTGACPAATPCDLKYAVETVAVSGDTVTVTAGTYSVAASIVAGSGITVRGASGARPQLIGIASLTGPPLTSSGTVGNLMIESQNSSVALDLTGTGMDLEAYSTTGNALRLHGSSQLTTAVVSTSAANATALSLADGVLTGATVRHATVVATGSGSTGLDASGLNLLGIGAPDVVSSIVKGGTTDISGALLNTVNVTYSSFRTASSTGVSASGTNVNAAAQLVDVGARNFQQLSTSPTVNTGNNADAAASDLAGNPRSIGGAPDMGALELPIPPEAATGAFSSLTATSVTVAGTVNPRATATTYHFDWGTTNPPASPTADQSAGSANAGASHTASLTGLLPGTTYYYRVSATSTWGTTEGSIASFATPSVAPVATTDAPTSVDATSAQLMATVNPGGAATNAELQWGSDTAYGRVAASGSVASGAADVAFNSTVTGLTPNTQYHYRVVATNGNGTTYGADRTFTTSVRAPILTAPAASGVSSSAATVTGTVDPGGGTTQWSLRYGVGASYGTSASGGSVSGNATLTVAQTLAGLLPGTTYSYRMSANNSAGTTLSAGGQFTTAVAAPTAESRDVAGVHPGGATARGELNPGGGATTYRFEYGPTTDYGLTTAPAAVGAGTDSVRVSAGLSGLSPATDYHYRVVVENSAGTARGRDRAFTTGPEPATDSTGSGGGDRSGGNPTGPAPVQADGLPAPAPSPPVGESANAAPNSGTVRVRVPGSDHFVELTEGAAIPVGSVVDASEGEVAITSASDSRGGTQTANFTGSEFKLLQRRASRPITDIVLTGGSLTECTPRVLTKIGDVEAAGRRKWSRRRLWGNGHGRFRTRGRHGTATVRGTWWLTEDRCDGTLVRVRRGLVEVRDLELRKTVMVPAGESYFAQVATPKKARTKKSR